MPSSSGFSTVLTHRVVHRLPHFERHYELGAPYILSFRDLDCRVWHEEFSSRIFAAVGCGQHLPVYRMSHGEFIMAVGYQLPPGTSFRSRLIHRYVQLQRRLGLLPVFFSGSSDNSYEVFSANEIARARAIYTAGLRNIAQEGILAAAFNENPGYIEYLPKYLSWLEQKQVPLHAGNYVPFYSVYALLLGPEGKSLLRGRHVLVVTSFTAEKERRLKMELNVLGVASVQLYPVSACKAMFDKLDLSSIRHPVDIALIGAGVGAASILEQLKPIRAVAIDAGFAIDAMAFPEKRWNRPFCVSDETFVSERVKFLEVEDIARLRILNAAQGRNSALLDEIELRIQQA